ncbi:MAG: sensor histidine kinase [Desulfobacterium sp.]|nr:sensor histidine kinase [Desulfobacterium sp.]MBU3947350.1 sensor histidine kinase [Pseudomonadota bacterium]
MVLKTDIYGDNALKFFGNMTASISHEVNNVLAIINENAGLLGDLCAMAERGHPVDPGRIKTASQKIINQVQRGDAIIKNLNKFAHSVDEPDCDVNISDIIFLISGLSERIAVMRGVKLEINEKADPVIVTSNPFLLITLIWFFLDFAMSVAGKKKTVYLNAEKKQDKAVITFSNLEGLAGIQTDKFPGEREQKFLTALSAKATTEVAAEKINILF